MTSSSVVLLSILLAAYLPVRSATDCQHQGIKQMRYQTFPDDRTHDWINPGRGFYRTLITSANSSLFQPIKSSTLNCWREQDGINLLLREYILDEFRDGRRLSAAFLQKFRRDLESARNAGWSLILRFMYSHRIELNYNTNEEPSEDGIVRHIQQLSPVIKDYAGVILALQAGFHGEYGLWYEPGAKLAWGVQKRTVDALLQYIPSSVQIQVSYPAYKYLEVPSGMPCTSQDINNSPTPASCRIGHFHECLIGGHGTNSLGSAFPELNNKTNVLNYLNKDTEFTLMGGKTCHPGDVTSNTIDYCAKSEKLFKELHLSYLDLEDPQEMINVYKQNQCFQTFHNSLGYRLVKISVNTTVTVKQNTDYCISIAIENRGYATPTTDMDVFFVFHQKNSAGGGHFYRFNTTLNTRILVPGTKVVFPTTLAIEPIPVGEYEVFLAIVDDSLEDYPDYYVLFSNEDAPLAPYGLNRIANITVLPGSSNHTQFSGSTTLIWNPPRAPSHTRSINKANTGSCVQLPNQPAATSKPPVTTGQAALSKPFVNFTSNPQVFQTCNKRNVVAALVDINRYYHSTSTFCPDRTRTPPDVIPKIFCNANEAITWSPAGRVIDNCDTIKHYTPVAVFVDKFGLVAYDSASGVAGVFLGCIKDGSVVKGIKLAIQFCGQSFDVVNILPSKHFDTLDKLYVIKWI